MAEPAKPGLRERKKAKTRRAIQQHALRLFAEQGYHATTIEQIIDAAEVSESTFFRYFPTKEDLVLQDDHDPQIATAFRAQPSHLATLPAMRAAFAQVLGGGSAEQRDEQRQRIALIVSVPSLRARLLDQYAQAMQLLADAIAERSNRRPDDLAIRTTAGALIGAMMAVVAAMADDPDADLAATIDQALGHLQAGLAAAPAPAGDDRTGNES